MINSKPLLNQARTNKECADEDGIHLLGQALKACGDPLRLQILQVLRLETFGVLELTQLFDTKQSGMSHHLKVLSQSGLVEAQREGNAVFYRRPLTHDSEPNKTTAEQLFSLIDRFPLEQRLSDKIRLIREQRAVQSQAFFARNADRLQEQQELIANHSLYAQCSFDLLSQEISANQEQGAIDQVVMEVGPGEGLFLKALSDTYTKVIALDNSKDMLNKARAFALTEGIENIDFILSDTHDYQQTHLEGKRDSVDAVVMNMVLHHVSAPSQIFFDVYSFLKPGGTLVVCDLSRHHQEWAKESCGDLWLGFEAEELLSWAKKAGFYEQNNAYIGLRNGFQIQLRKFKKPDNT
jgi:ubiquinone/menaquinone biosynthesis C-methylase UbiE/DNA-binding transcriptional ArsR family regulator